MRAPLLAQGLEASPSVVGGKVDGEDISDFTIEVGEATLRSAEHADFEFGQLLKAVSEQPTDDGFSRARVSCDQGETAFAHEIFKSEGERVDARRYKQGLRGNIGEKGVPLEPVEGEQFLGHGFSLDPESVFGM